MITKSKNNNQIRSNPKYQKIQPRLKQSLVYKQPHKNLYKKLVHKESQHLQEVFRIKAKVNVMIPTISLKSNLVKNRMINNSKI